MGVLSPAYALQPPTDRKLRQAWELLDDSFAAGPKEKSVIEPLMALLNPPYGYDYNTLILIFTGWFGYYNHDIELRERGQIAKHEIFTEFLQKGPRDFLQHCKQKNIALLRRNPDDARVAVLSIIDRKADLSFTQEEANAAIAKLESFHKDTRNNQRDRETAQAKVTTLSEAVTIAKRYQEEVGKIQRKVDTEQKYSSMLTALNELKQLPRLTLVKTNVADPATLQQRILAQLEATVESTCQRLARPERITEIELNRRQLTNMQDEIKRAGINQVDEKIQIALNTLQQAAQELEKRQSEEGVRAEINDVDLLGSLIYLQDKAKRLQQMSGYTGEVLRVRDQKLADIANAITELEGKIQLFQAQIDTVTSLDRVESLRDQLLKLSARYDDSLHQADVQAALHRLAQFRDFFRNLNQLPTRLPHQRSDVDALLSEYKALRHEYQPILCTDQIKVIERAEQSIHEQVESKQKEARCWLQTCAEEFRKGTNVSLLVEKLSSLPAFFPDDERCQLDRLCEEVQGRINNDAILKVETAFRAIADRSKQEECIQRLTQIMNEQTTTSWAFWRKRA